MKVINPIQSQAVREGKVANVIHAIALDMMGRRAHLLQSSRKVSQDESRLYRKQSRLLEEYATALDAIYYQLEPTKWDPETSGDLLELAQAHHITLPDWMFADRMEPVEETIESALNRFENEGGRNSHTAATL